MIDKIACGAGIMLIQEVADSYKYDCDVYGLFFCRLLGCISGYTSGPL